MLLNRSLLILKREENHTIQGWHHFFSGLNATEKCKRNEKFKKKVVSHIHKIFTYVWKEWKVAYQLKS